MENLSGFCTICNHKHRGEDQCQYCHCTWANVSTGDNNMIKFIKKWWKKYVDWLFKW
jgi:hypothetical protein